MVVKLSDTFERMGRQLALGYIVFISRTFFAIADAESEVLKLTCKEITADLVGLCSKANPSVLENCLLKTWLNFHGKLFMNTNHFATQCTSTINTASILFFNARIVDRWLPNKVSELVNTRLYLPSEASLFLVSELSGPTTTALIPFSPAICKVRLFPILSAKSSKHLDH